jgi:galactokinase
MNAQARAADYFRRKFGHPCDAIARAPGRVNLLGEHVDYNDGRVLPAAIDRGTYVAFSPSSRNSSTIWAADYRQVSHFSASPVDNLRAARDGLSGWARYPAGVAWSLGQDGLAVKDIDAVFSSDVPRGAGLSSSASVELAFATAWKSLGGWQLSPMNLALLCQRAENKYVGVNCGIMDQAASACGQADHLLLLDCRSLEFQLLPLPSGSAIIVADTGVRHSLATSEYNDRRWACEEAMRLLQPELPGITALRDVSLADFNRLAASLPPIVEKRARHVVEEIDRTQQAIDLLQVGDLPGFGHLMNECHRSLRDLYEVSCPELDIMTRIAQSLEGCFGARLTGAGFGGCTVNLVALSRAGEFSRELASGYENETGRHAEVYVCQATAGAGLV